MRHPPSANINSNTNTNKPLEPRKLLEDSIATLWFLQFEKAFEWKPYCSIFMTSAALECQPLWLTSLDPRQLQTGNQPQKKIGTRKSLEIGFGQIYVSRHTLDACKCISPLGQQLQAAWVRLSFTTPPPTSGPPFTHHSDFCFKQRS